MAAMISGQDGEIYVAVGPKGSTNTYDLKWEDGVGGEVKQILVWHEDLIHGIQVVYERHGSTVVSQRHGGNGGEFDLVCLDGPLVRVTGTFGSYCIEPEVFADEEEAPYNYIKVIRSLKFETSTGSTYGPFGSKMGEPFSFKASNGISGFHGRSSVGDYGYLNAIGVYVKTMATGLLQQPLVRPLVASGSSAAECLIEAPPATAPLVLKGNNIEENESEGRQPEL